MHCCPLTLENYGGKQVIFRVRYHVISKETMREPVNGKKNPALELLASH